MMSRFSSLLFSVALFALAFTACKKDELTVVSTAPTGHVCGKKTIEVNVDSVIQASGGPWGDMPELHYTFCSCDTVELIPVNVQDPWYFERWFFGQWPDEADYWEPVLDTITTGTALTLDVHNDVSWPNHLHFQVVLHEEQCK